MIEMCQLRSIHQVVYIIKLKVVEGLVVILEASINLVAIKNGALGFVNQLVVMPVVGVLLCLGGQARAKDKGNGEKEVFHRGMVLGVNNVTGIFPLLF